MIILVHQCDAKGCEENLVNDGNFDNNMEWIMAKESGYIKYDSLPGQIRMGCIAAPKRGSRFCEEYL